MPAPEIELHIESLVVDGVDVGDPRRVADALERELQRLLAAHDPPAAWARGHAVPHHRDAHPLAPPPNTTPEDWGHAIAQRVHASLTAQPDARTPPTTPAHGARTT